MPKLASMNCPNCGAAVALTRGSDEVVCSYCGASSLVRRPEPPSPPPRPQPPYGPRPQPPYGRPHAPLPYAPGRSRSGAGASVAVALVLVALVAGGAFFAMQPRGRSQAVSSGADHPGRPLPAEVLPTEPARIPDGMHAPLVADLDGDGADELVLAVRQRPGTRTGYAAFDAASGKLRWETEDLGDGLARLRATTAHGRLLVADESGELRAYDGKSGARLWSLPLGERVVRTCAGPGASQVTVWTKDERQHVIDLDAGTAEPLAKKSKSCPPLPSDTKPARDFEAFADDDAPAGVESYTCGGIRVTGDRNYVVPERCGPRTGLDLGKLDGFEPASIWRHAAGWLLLGYRQPGTRVGMLGLAEKGKLVWSAVVASGNPLDAQEGKPTQVALAGDAVLAGYDLRAGPHHLVCFEVRTGARRWDVELATSRGVDHVVTSQHAVYVSAGGRVTALGLGDGRKLFEFGTEH